MREQLAQLWAAGFDPSAPEASLAALSEHVADWTLAGQAIAELEAMGYLVNSLAEAHGVSRASIPSPLTRSNLVGFTASGSPVRGLVHNAANVFRQRLDVTESASDAATSARNWLEGVALNEPMRVGNQVILDAAMRDRRFEPRYVRVVSGDACSFCNLIASRGYTQAGVGFLAHTRTRRGGGDCRCTPGPMVNLSIDPTVRPAPSVLSVDGLFAASGDWATDLKAIKALETDSWFMPGDGKRDVHLEQLKAVGEAINERAIWQVREWTKPDAPARFRYMDGRERAVLARRMALEDIRAMSRGNLRLNDWGGMAWKQGAALRQMEAEMARCRELLGEANKVFPQEWVTGLNRRGGITMLGQGPRGFYQEAKLGGRGAGSIMLGQHGQRQDRNTAKHELGHAIQRSRTQVTRAEQYFHRYRTTNSKGKREAMVGVSGKHRPNEVGRKDKYPLAYSGREYTHSRRALEVLTTSVEGVMGTNTSYVDAEMRHWVLGVLALL